MSPHLGQAAPADLLDVRRRPRAGWLAIVLAGTALMAAACSSSSSSSTTPPPNPAQAQAQLQTVYNTFFNLADKSVDAKLAAIQNGESVRAATTDALNSQLASSSTGATVSQATLLTSSQCKAQNLPYPCAKVTYSILGPGGQVLLANSGGYAVYINGKWYVAKQTVCGLFQLLYQTEQKSGTPPGC
jgi:hypothetical protein